MGSVTGSVDMSLSKLGEIVEDREARRAAVRSNGCRGFSATRWRFRTGAGFAFNFVVYS